MPRRNAPFKGVLFVIITIAAGLTACGSGGSSTSPPPPPPPTFSQVFKHVVVIFKKIARRIISSTVSQTRILPRAVSTLRARPFNLRPSR